MYSSLLITPILFSLVISEIAFPPLSRSTFEAGGGQDCETLEAVELQGEFRNLGLELSMSIPSSSSFYVNQSAIP